MRVFGTIIALLAFGVFASADCRIVQRHVVVDNHVQAIAVAQFVPLVVQVPTYSVTYSDPVAELRKEITELRQELKQAQTAPMPKADAPPGGRDAKDASVDVMKIFNNKCASCHEKGVAKAKGGDFVLLEGSNFAQLNFKQALRVGTKVFTSEMPKGKDKCSDEEVAAVMQWLDSLK